MGAAVVTQVRIPATTFERRWEHVEDILSEGLRLSAHFVRPPGTTRVTALLVLLVVQGAIGYIQYFNDIPALLVGFHVAGATAVWSATLMLLLGMYEHEPRPATTTTDAPVLAPV